MSPENPGVRAGGHPDSVQYCGRLGRAIFRPARVHRAHATQPLRGFGLHPGQELLGAAGLVHSTVSRTLRRMQEAGLLAREAAWHDQGVMRASLADKGHSMREDPEEMRSALEQASASDLDGFLEQFVAKSAVVRRDVIERNSPASTSTRPVVIDGGGQTHNQEEEVQI